MCYNFMMCCEVEAILFYVSCGGGVGEEEIDEPRI